MSLLYFFIIIAFLIFIHELGHLLAAKWANVKVENFSIGFGPKIFKFNIGETEYSLSLLPLGGYVKMQGESPDSTSTDKIIDPNRSYQNIPNYKKQIILFSGPLMNLILPFVLFPLIYINGVEMPKYLTDKVIIEEKLVLDNQIDLIKNDEIVSINDIKIKSWQDFYLIDDNKLNQKVSIEILRGNEIKKLQLNLYQSDLKNLIKPNFKPVIGDIMPNSLAEKNGIMIDDEILKINNSNISSWTNLVNYLKNSKEMVMVFLINRNNTLISKEIIFKSSNNKVLGISPRVETIKESLGFLDSVKKSYLKSIETIKLIFFGIMELLEQLFSTDSSAASIKDSLAGPIAIAKYSGAAAEKGINAMLQFTIIISINLGIINLLPIPLLDGGHIFLNSIEMLTRRKINAKVLNFINKIGFAILISLMIFAIYNDIMNL
ncbi:RIP metalloprotease RseP [bacterium]|nr:RIP metalloprotease RseP [bacterium]